MPALLGFETAGAELTPDDISEMLDWPGVIGLGEVMDYRAVVRGDERMRAITAAARAKGKLIDGHCTNLERRRAERLPRRGDRLRPHQEPGRDHHREGPAGHARR